MTVAEADSRRRTRERLSLARQPDERLRLLPRQEPLEQPGRPVLARWRDRARSARRLQGQACPRVPADGLRARRKEGPVANRLGNHIQAQPVIHVAEDGKTAKIRARMLQQMSMGGPRARTAERSTRTPRSRKMASGSSATTMLSTRSPRATQAAGRRSRRATSRVRARTFPPDAPPRLVFDMFPSVYNIPFHYANPVTGRTDVPAIKENTRMKVAAATPAVPGKMPPDVAAALREIGLKSSRASARRRSTRRCIRRSRIKTSR